MKNTNLIEGTKKHMAPVLGRMTDIQVSHGKGSYLVDINDQRYLDFGAGIAVNSTGHCHPHVVDAIQKQAKTLLHGCAGIVYYEQNIALAEKISQIANGPDSIFFTQSGTEAIEAALKCALYVTNKPNVVVFKGSFHGRTLGALSITTSNPKYLDRYPMALPNKTILEYPYLYRLNAPLNKEANYLDYLETSLNQLDDSIAAIIIEPFLGEGGYYLAPSSVLKTLRDWCSNNNVLLIFDEIQSGIGRTGKWFCYQHHNVIPDIITMAKGIGSGLPLGACLAKKDIMTQWTQVLMVAPMAEIRSLVPQELQH